MSVLLISYMLNKLIFYQLLKHRVCVCVSDCWAIAFVQNKDSRIKHKKGIDKKEVYIC